MMREKETGNIGVVAADAIIRSPSPIFTRSSGDDHQDQQASGDNNNNNNGGMRTAETLFRLIPIAPCIAALVVMLHNSQTNDFGSVSYSHLGAFRYLTIYM